MHKQAIHYRRLRRMESGLRWVWDASSAFGAYSIIPPTMSLWHLYMLALASVADPRLFHPRVSDGKTINGHATDIFIVELPNATGQTGKTAPGDLLHLRQGPLFDHGGMEGVSSRTFFESSGLRKQE